MVSSVSFGKSVSLFTKEAEVSSLISLSEYILPDTGSHLNFFNLCWMMWSGQSSTNTISGLILMIFFKYWFCSSVLGYPSRQKPMDQQSTLLSLFSIMVFMKSSLTMSPDQRDSFILFANHLSSWSFRASFSRLLVEM